MERKARLLVGNGSHQAIGHFKMKIYGGVFAPFYGVLTVNDKYTNPKIKVYLSFAYPHLLEKAKEMIKQGKEYWVRGYPSMNKDGEIYEVVITSWTLASDVSPQFMDYKKQNPDLFGDETNPLVEKILLTGRFVNNVIEVQESIYKRSNLKKYKKTGYLQKRKYTFIGDVPEGKDEQSTKWAIRKYCNTFICYRGDTINTAKKITIAKIINVACTVYKKEKRYIATPKRIK